jgi:sulfur carrier protein ThiS
MSAKFRLNGSLHDVVGGPSEYMVESGRTVRETLVSLHIEPLTVALVIVNKVRENKDYIIRDGDEVMVMAVIGGGVKSNGRERLNVLS